MTLPWPGEQIYIGDGATLAGGKSPYSYPDGYAYAWDMGDVDNRTAELVTGDDVYLYTGSTSSLLETDVIGECNWIVDVISASGATVEIFNGYDVDWDYNDAAIAASWTPATVTLVPGRNLIPLPAERRTWSALYRDGAALLRFKVTAGSIVIDRVMLQVEPPDGLKVQTGWHFGDFITPPTTLQRARTHMVVDWYGLGQGTSPHSTTTNFNPPGGSLDDLNRSDRNFNPSYHDKVVEAWGAMPLAQHNDLGIGFAEFGGGALWFGLIDGRGVAQPGLEATQVWEYWGSTTKNGTFCTALWEDFPTYHVNRNPGGIDPDGTYNPYRRAGLLGRDYVTVDGSSFEWNSDQQTHAVSWRPGALLPTSAYLQDQHPSENPVGSVLRDSPHGELFNVTGVMSFSTPVAPVGTLNNSWTHSSVSRTAAGSTYYEVTPAAGTDLTLSVSVELGGPAETTPPYGDGVAWKDAWTNNTTATFSVYWVDVVNSPTNGLSLFESTPQLFLQMPDYRNKVPDWTLSPDAILPAPLPPPPPPPAAQPGAGYYVIPNPNLGGGLDGVAVHFTSI